MVSARTKSVIERAKQLYRATLQPLLDPYERGRYVAIEPDSREYFVAHTFDAAVDAALRKHPDRLTHTMRIGHPAALHMGVLMR